MNFLPNYQFYSVENNIKVSSSNLIAIPKLRLFQLTFFPFWPKIHYARIVFSCGKRSGIFGIFLHMRRIETPVNFLQEDAEVTKAFEEDIETPPTRNIPSPGQLDPDMRIPVINLEDGTRLVGEDAPKNKDLVEWLKLHPSYTVDMPSYVPVSTLEFRREESCPRVQSGGVLRGQPLQLFCTTQRRSLVPLPFA